MLDELTKVSAQLRIDKAQECLKDAKTLISSGSYASSANRSYFCIFHALQAVLCTIGFSSKKHSGNISEFRKSFIKTGKFPVKYSDVIGNAFNTRTKSDYDIHYIIVKADVEKQLKDAEDFLTDVEAYLKSL